MLYILEDVSCLKASSHSSAGPAALHIVRSMLVGFSRVRTRATSNKFQFTVFHFKELVTELYINTNDWPKTSVDHQLQYQTLDISVYVMMYWMCMLRCIDYEQWNANGIVLQGMAFLVCKCGCRADGSGQHSPSRLLDRPSDSWRTKILHGAWLTWLS